MAFVAVIFGGAFGFLSAIVSLILFNASWLLALAIWSFGGVAVALVLVALAMIPRHTTIELIAEHA